MVDYPLSRHLKWPRTYTESDGGIDLSFLLSHEAQCLFSLPPLFSFPSTSCRGVYFEVLQALQGKMRVLEQGLKNKATRLDLVGCDEMLVSAAKWK